MPPTTTEKRLDEIENAIVSLNHGVSCFKPVQLARPEHAGLRVVVERVAARNGGQETRPYVLPGHTQVGGRAA
jgi:hypothetical protein